MNIAELIKEYYQFRGLVMPNEDQAFKFLVSEVGELADALVSAEKIIPGPVSSAGNCEAVPWVRNNPGKERNIEDEAGDVLMMLYVTCMERGINPHVAMLRKFARKGFALPDGAIKY